MTGFILRNLRYHARSHLGAFLGVFVATAVIVGALAIGDCVRGSLTDLALQRLGKVQYAIAPGDRFFRAQLADDLSSSISNGLTTAVLQLPGIAVSPDDSARANQVQILGISDSFWSLAQTPPSFTSIPSNGVVLNEPLARQLHASVGDSILIRAQKPSLLSSEAPMSPREDVAAAMRLTVAAIVTDAQFGRFGLQAGIAPPLNAFVPIPLLQQKSEQPGKANLLLTGPLAPGADLPSAIRKNWQLADASLQFREVPDGLELRSDRIFLDPQSRSAIASTGPRLANERDVLTYFVNELRDGPRATPYSMVTAAGSPWTTNLADDEIILSQWLADDLAAKTNDQVSLKYFVLGSSHRLEEKERSFRVSRIVPPDLPWADRTLMPDFPGIAKAEKTENWDAGFRIDMQKIRPKDERYWKEFRGTPKAFITLAAGQQMWSNRFGDLTGIRFPLAGISGVMPQAALLAHLDPVSVGLSVRPLRDLALNAASQAEDLGQYFLAFSFFIVTAALILLALLFQFALEKRATEIGVLLALGWRPKQVRRLLLGEGIAVAAVGGIAGVIGGLLYTKFILYGLATLWSAAVNHTPLQFHVTGQTLAVGAFSGMVVSALVIWLALRAQSKRPARELLERGNEAEPPPKKRKWAGLIAIICGLEGVGQLIASAVSHEKPGAVMLLSAGALLLTAGIFGAAAFLRRLNDSKAHRLALRGDMLPQSGGQLSPNPLSLFSLALRNCVRRRKRSLATIALLASGSFVIVIVAANKIDAHQDGASRSSGTGGFAFLGESALPVVQDLNSSDGREFFGLDEKTLANVAFVPFRVHAGDDASCLNLNSVQTPRLLGVDPQTLADRKAFTFATAPKNGWRALTNSGDEIPAIGDDASITYSLHKSIGDTIDYVDERGQSFKLKLVGSLANSVLQGNLIIADSAFVYCFPSDDGARLFLIDCPSDTAPVVSAALTRGLQDRGLQLTSAADRLNDFNAVQNAYLDTFQALGALGLLLGSAGVGVVVLRNVLERRPELAAMSAMGFSRRVLSRFVLTEHAALELVGLFIGVGAAGLSVLPALLSPRASISWASLCGTLAMILEAGMIFTWLATRLALRGPLLNALRDE
jgi:ABC-type antimicrobial peptide transport system permease subunit